MIQKAIYLFRAAKLRWLLSEADRRRCAPDSADVDGGDRLLASQIPPGSSVLGVNAPTLAAHLPPGCEYRPCELEGGRLPATAGKHDVVVCGGLEYLARPQQLLSRLPELGRMALLSYPCCRMGEDHLRRMSYGWVNHFSRRGLEVAFGRAGLDFELAGQSGARVVYRLRPAPLTVERVRERLGYRPAGRSGVPALLGMPA